MIEEERVETALSCLTVALRLWKEGNHEKSLLFLDKSLSAHPTKEATLLKERFLKELASGITTDGSDGDSPAKGFAASQAAPRPVPAVQQRPAPTPVVPAPAAPNYTTEQQELSLQIVQLTNYYAILGIAKEAKADEIKRAFRKLAIKLHPDKNNSPAAEDAFKKVNQAYTCLSDEKKKIHYDIMGEDEDGGGKDQQVEQDLTPEDVHDLFFDPTGKPRPSSAPPPRTGPFAFAYLSPLFLLFLFTYMASLPRLYSLELTATHTIPRTTPGNVNFFVSPTFAISYDYDPRAQATAYYTVELRLAEACAIETKFKEDTIEEAMRLRGVAHRAKLSEAEALPLDSCASLRLAAGLTTAAAAAAAG